MKKRYVLVPVFFIFIVAVFLILRSNFKRYERNKAKENIETFYYKLKSRDINSDYFAIQAELYEVMSRNKLEADQIQRLSVTRDSLRLVFENNALQKQQIDN